MNLSELRKAAGAAVRPPTATGLDLCLLKKLILFEEYKTNSDKWQNARHRVEVIKKLARPFIPQIHFLYNIEIKNDSDKL